MRKMKGSAVKAIMKVAAKYGRRASGEMSSFTKYEKKQKNTNEPKMM